VLCERPVCKQASSSAFLPEACKRTLFAWRTRGSLQPCVRSCVLSCEGVGAGFHSARRARADVPFCEKKCPGRKTIARNKCPKTCSAVTQSACPTSWKHGHPLCTPLAPGRRRGSAGVGAERLRDRQGELATCVLSAAARGRPFFDTAPTRLLFFRRAELQATMLTDAACLLLVCIAALRALARLHAVLNARRRLDTERGDLHQCQPAAPFLAAGQRHCRRRARHQRPLHGNGTVTVFGNRVCQSGLPPYVYLSVSLSLSIYNLPLTVHVVFRTPTEPPAL
jgi:hypothetical protein